MDFKRKLELPPDDYDPVAPLTDEEIKGLHPARELFAELGIPLPGTVPERVDGGAKQSLTIDLDAEALDYFRSTGPGWQRRINEVLVREARKKSA